MLPGRPALLSGEPAFESLVPIVRPTLPTFDAGMAREFGEIFETGMVSKGRHLQEFEAQLADHLGVQEAIAVSSCTLGLLFSYDGLALEGEVLVPSFTFMATVHPLRWIGARPVFVDIDPDTWNVDPEQVEAHITDRTTAIVAVHNFGNPAPVEDLEAIARKRGLRLVFDAAHGFGAKFHGRPVGPFGDAEVFSLSPTKLVVAGEGGVVATNDRKLAQHVRYGREYGNPGDYGSLFPGLNARMSELHALLGKHSLANLEENATSRNRVVAIIRDRLERLPGIRFQQVHSGNRCSYKDLSMVVEERAFGLTRDELAQALRPEGVDTRKYHDPPVHRHRAYEDLQMKVRESLPVTAHIAPRSISLPIWSHMPEEIADRICMAVERIHGHASEIRRELRA